MRELEFTLVREYIELNKLLKILALVESGGQANRLIEEGFVRFNGTIDTRKRLKLRQGDKVEFDTVRGEKGLNAVKINKI